MSLFLWSESPQDLPPDAAWVSVAHRGPRAGSGLSMKAQAVSPCVQDFCSALDAKLQVQLDDLLAYLPSADASPPKDVSPVQAKSCAFDRYADAGTVLELLQAQSVACIERITACIRAELHGSEQVVQGQRDALDSVQLHAVLFMARLCQSLGELCPHLKQCVLGKSRNSEKPARDPKALKKQGKGTTREVLPSQAKWQEVKELLLRQSVMGYRVWSSAVVKVSDRPVGGFFPCSAATPRLPPFCHVPGWPASARAFRSKGIMILISRSYFYFSAIVRWLSRTRFSVHIF